ncbi:MAG: hypothetical protein WBD31_31995 [Rubripirellula sp.]
MTAETLLATLSTRGIIVTVAGDSIELDAPAGVLTDNDVSTLRERKADVLTSLRSRCRPHNDTSNYIDLPDTKRPGWTLSTCKLCSCFVGYRYTLNRDG